MQHRTFVSPMRRVTLPGSAAMRRGVVLLGIALAAFAAGGAAQAAPPETGAGSGPVVVELFTSQGCFSCPPAEAMLAELAQRDGIVALEHHVDYWDSLNYGAAGRWKDVFSRPAATERQRVYAAVVPGRGHSYTPQMVVDGRYEMVGSSEGDVSRAIAKAGQSQQPRLAVSAEAAGADGLRIRVAGAVAPANGEGEVGIWLVHFLREHATQVTRGENHGKTLTGRNIVLEMTRVGAWQGGEATIDLAGARPDAKHGCAVIVQADGQGPILGASYCEPGPASNS
jgi:hypothetical protein